MEQTISQKKFSAQGFLYDKDEQTVLLHLRDNKTKFNPNKWAFFGGAGEGGETPEECFIRELREETEIVVVKDEIIPLRSYFNDEFQTQRNVFFVKKYVPRSAIVLHEGKDCEWVPLARVFMYDLSEKTRNDLLLFVETLRK